MEALGLRPDGIYIDATLGGGGHTRAIAEALGTAATSTLSTRTVRP